MHKMARYSRAAAQQHPTNPTTLEDLVLPSPYITATSGEPLLLWDSGYTTKHRRSFLFGTPQNTSVLQDADHFIIDGTFKTSPNLMTQMFTVHGLLKNNLPSRNSVHPFGIQCKSEFSAQILLT